MDVQTRRDISRTIEDSDASRSCVCRVDWPNNWWPWLTLSGHFMPCALYLQ